jgi:hypothetical protein
MSRISRAHEPYVDNPAEVVTVADAVANSETIDMRPFAMLRFRRHSGSVATLTWFESDSPAGPWVASRANNVAAAQSTGDYWDNLVLELAGAMYLRAQGNVAGEIKVVKKG